MDLVDFITACTMLLLPVHYFKKMRTIVKRRSNVVRDDTEITLSAAVLAVLIINSGGKFPVIFYITMIGYMYVFTIFNVMLLKKPSNRFVILFELPAFYILARLTATFTDPVEFAKTVCNTSVVFASLMRVIFRGPTVENATALFVNGVNWSIFYLLLSDIFILIPNLVGAILGLVLAIRYRRK